MSKNFFINLFDISVAQKQLLSNLLIVYVIYLPIELIDSGFFEIVRLKNNLKIYRNRLVFFYILLIVFDSIEFIFTKSLIMLYVATILAHIINIIYLSIKFDLP